MRLFLIGLIMMSLSGLSFAENPLTGLWLTVDDSTGEEKSWVRIVERDGKLYGTIERLLLRPMDDVCEPCEPPLKNKPIVGMQIIDGLTRSGFYYSNGQILDPGNGKFYKCKIWLGKDGLLNVRGYIGFFYRTQQWHRLSEAASKT